MEQKETRRKRSRINTKKTRIWSRIMAYKQLKMVPLHTVLIVGVVLIGALSSTAVVMATNPDTNSPANTRIIQFRDANFSVWNEKVKYNSTAMTNPKGMEPLYNITTIILDFFLGKKPIPDGKFKTKIVKETPIFQPILYKRFIWCTFLNKRRI